MNIHTIATECELEKLVLHLKQIRDSSRALDEPSIRITEKLTSAICEYFQKQGHKVALEVNVETKYIPRQKDREPYIRPGRLDLVVDSPNRWQLAIEIDRGNKKWSVEKLKHVQTNNKNTFGIWIRWGGQLRNVDTSAILLINLTSETPTILWPSVNVAA